MDIKNIDNIVLLEEIENLVNTSIQEYNYDKLALTKQLIKEGIITYNDILEHINSNKMNEGIIGSLIGGFTGLTLGKLIGEAIANALGIKEGLLYDLLTSRFVAMAVGSKIGKKML